MFNQHLHEILRTITHRDSDEVKHREIIYLPNQPTKQREIMKSERRKHTPPLGNSSIIITQMTYEQARKLSNDYAMEIIMHIPPRTIPVVTPQQWKGVQTPQAKETNTKDIVILTWLQARDSLTKQDINKCQEWCTDNKFKIKIESITQQRAHDIKSIKPKKYPLYETWLKFKPTEEPMELWLARSSKSIASWLSSQHHIPSWMTAKAQKKLITTQLKYTSLIWKKRCDTNIALKPIAERFASIKRLNKEMEDSQSSRSSSPQRGTDPAEETQYIIVGNKEATMANIEDIRHELMPIKNSNSFAPLTETDDEPDPFPEGEVQHIDESNETISLTHTSEEGSKPPCENADDVNLDQLPTKTITDMLYSINPTRSTVTPSSHNTAIYGELTRQSITKVMQTLTRMGLTVGKTFVDIGAGLGRPCYHAIEELGARFAAGIELEGSRWWQSITTLLKILKTPEGKKCQNLFFAHGDASVIEDIDIFDVIYSFDEGFPHSLKKHLGKKYRETSAEYIIVFSKDYSLYELGESFEEPIKVKVSMQAQGGQHTAKIFRRKDTASQAITLVWTPPQTPSRQRDSLPPPAITRLLTEKYKQGWLAFRQGRKQYIHWLDETLALPCPRHLRTKRRETTINSDEGEGSQSTAPKLPITSTPTKEKKKSLQQTLDVSLFKSRSSPNKIITNNITRRRTQKQDQNLLKQYETLFIEQDDRWILMAIAEDWFRFAVLQHITAGKDKTREILSTASSRLTGHRFENMIKQLPHITTIRNICQAEKYSSAEHLAGKLSTTLGASLMGIIPEHITNEFNNKYIWKQIAKYLLSVDHLVSQTDIDPIVQLKYEYTTRKGYGIYLSKDTPKGTDIKNLWAETRQLSNEFVKLCEDLHTATGSSHYEHPTTKSLYDIMGPLAFANGSCKQDANILPISKEEAKIQNTWKKDKRKRVDTHEYKTEWSAGHTIKDTLITSECRIFYGNTYDISCENCTLDAAPPPKRRKLIPKPAPEPTLYQQQRPKRKRRGDLSSRESDNRNVPPDKRRKTSHPQGEPSPTGETLQTQPPPSSMDEEGDTSGRAQPNESAGLDERENLDHDLMDHG